MTKDKATATPQLVHSARQMLETRLAKYGDPRNLEWDFNDIRDKWERHAFSAFIDLQTVEAERDQLLAEVAELKQALRLTLSRAQVDRMLELQRQGFTGTIYEAREKGLMPEEYEPALKLVEKDT